MYEFRAIYCIYLPNSDSDTSRREVKPDIQLMKIPLVSGKDELGILSKSIKNIGRIAIAPAAVTTSGRRWQKLGVWQTTLINQLIIAGYYLGISPDKLGNFYRNRGKRC